MSFNMSALAEIDISSLMDEHGEDSEFYNWLRTNATFEHVDSFEFIHHLYPDESADVFVRDYLYPGMPDRLRADILEARRKGAARVCFYC